MTDNDRYLEPRQVGVVPPTAYENALGDALEAAFGDGIRELEPLVERLNRTRVRPPEGGEWTPELFRAVMKRLGG